MSVFLLCDQVTTSLGVFNDHVSTDTVISCLYMHCVEDDDIISYEDMEDEEGWFKFYDLDFDIHIEFDIHFEFDIQFEFGVHLGFGVHVEFDFPLCSLQV